MKAEVLLNVSDRLNHRKLYESFAYQKPILGTGIMTTSRHNSTEDSNAIHKFNEDEKEESLSLSCNQKNVSRKFFLDTNGLSPTKNVGPTNANFVYDENNMCLSVKHSSNPAVTSSNNTCSPLILVSKNGSCLPQSFHGSFQNTSIQLPIQGSIMVMNDRSPTSVVRAESENVKFCDVATPVTVYRNNGGLPESPEYARPSIIASVGSTGLNMTAPPLLDGGMVSPMLSQPANHPCLDIHVPVESSMQTGNSSPSPVSSPTYIKLFSNENEAVVAGMAFYECCWMSCDRKFLALDDLVNHVNDQHVKVERPDIDYQCKWERCPRKGKGFNARYKMLIHIRTHTNEKPHKCSICSKCFSRLENLKIHNRSHTGEKPYVCPFEGCNKAYSNSSDRFKHVRTHQEEKPYICKMPGCNKRYTDPSSLRKHVRTHGHYYRDNDKQNGKQRPAFSPPVPSSPVTLSLPTTTSQPVISSIAGLNMTLSPVGSLPHTAVPPQLMSVHNIMQVSNYTSNTVTGYTSNPLLSSTILSSTTKHTAATQTEGIIPTLSPTSPIKLDLSTDKSSDDQDDKCQDGPLDLSTTTSPDPDTDMEVGERDNSNFTSPKWDLMHS